MLRSRPSDWDKPDKGLIISSYCVQITRYNEEISEIPPVYFQMLDPIAGFSGREEELKKLETELFSKNLVVVSGLAGFGKTALAVKFAWDQREFFKNNLVFINAESEASLRLSFGDLSSELKINVNKDLNIQSVIEKVFLHFKNSKCLFIFDNAESYSSISSFLPTRYFEESTDIYVIVTSLSEDWGSCESFQLDALSPEGALNILKIIIKEYDSYSTTLWEDLIDCLDRIPLAIQIVGALISNKLDNLKLLNVKNKFNLEKYIEGLRTEKIDVTLKRLPSNTDVSYANTIYIAIIKSIDYLQSKNNHSLEILCALSYLNPICITKEHLSTILHEIQDLDNCLHEIIKLSLIRMNTSFNSICIHRLVQKILRNYQKEERISQKYINLIIHAILTDKQICYRHQNTVLPYLEENIDNCILFFDNNPNLREEYLLFLTENDSHIVLRAILKTYSKPCQSKVNKNISTIIKKLNLLKIALNNFSVSTIQLLVPYYFTNTNDMPTAYTLLSKQFQTGESNVIEIIQTLLKLYKNEYNYDLQIELLQTVIKTENVDLIKTFLSQRLDLIDINKQDFEGNTVIHNLLNCKNLKISRSSVIQTIDLISKTDILNPYTKNKSGQTIMSTILATKNCELINIFLTNILNNEYLFHHHGKRQYSTENLELKDVTDIRERLSFTHFCDENNEIYLNYPIRCLFKHKILHSLISGIKQPYTDKRERSVGKIIILMKHLKLVILCLSQPLSENDVNFIDKNHQTIVHHLMYLCAKSENFEDAIPIIEYLSKRGLNPFLDPIKNSIIIEQLMVTKCWTLVENIIKHTKDEYNFSTFQKEYIGTIIHMLFEYCEKDDANIAKILLNTKIVQINPLATNYFGKTCLEMVLLTKNWDIIQPYILKSINKHNINDQTKRGNTFLTLLLKNYTINFDHIAGLFVHLKDRKIKLFTKLNRFNKTLLQTVLLTEHCNLIHSFVLNNVTQENINDQDIEGNTLIHELFSHCNKEIIVSILEILKNFKIDPHVRNGNGSTVYDIVLQSAYRTSSNIINTFIKIAFTKDNVNHQDENGRTILYYLFHFNTHNFTLDEMKETLALLLNLGANPNIKDNCGESVLANIRFKRDYYLEIVKTLDPTTQKPKMDN